MDRGLGTSALELWIRRRPWVADGVFAALLAAVVLPMTVTPITGSSWSLSLKVIAVCAVLLAHACVTVRRVAPRSAFGVVSAVMLLLLVWPDLDVAGADDSFAPILLPSVVVFPIALYSVAAWCTPRTSVLALATAGAGTVLVLARLWGADYLTVTQPGLASRDDPVRSVPLFMAIGMVAAVVLPWGLGRYRRLRAHYVTELEERARREEQDRVESARLAAQEERTLIAREMHDVVAHSLSVMVSQAEGGRLMAQRDPSVVVPVLETVARTGQEAMRDMRSLLHALHNDAGAEDTSPQPGLAELPGLIERVEGSGLRVTYAETGDPLWVSGAGELAAYRVTQEALTNVLKHAGSDGSAQVRLDWQPGRLYLTIRNDPGRETPCPVRGGRGLSGMTGRVAVLGGTLTAGPIEGRGFMVRAAIPTLSCVDEWSP